MVNVAKNTTKPKLSQSQKSDLKALRKKGLYKPVKPRAAPTKYAKGLLSRFKDVLTGKASVVTAKGQTKRSKGFKEAAQFNRGQSSGTVRAIRNKIIVPTQVGEVARFSKKSGKVRVTRNINGAKYVREPFPKRPRDFRDAGRSLRPGDRIAVPSWRGDAKGVEWYTLSAEEWRMFWLQYGPKGSAETRGGKKHRYNDLLSHIQISRRVGKDADFEDIEPDEYDAGERGGAIGAIKKTSGRARKSSKRLV
jgi:hypothetical protein